MRYGALLRWPWQRPLLVAVADMRACACRHCVSSHAERPDVLKRDVPMLRAVVAAGLYPSLAVASKKRQANKRGGGGGGVYEHVRLLCAACSHHAALPRPCAICPRSVASACARKTTFAARAAPADY